MKPKHLLLLSLLLISACIGRGNQDTAEPPATELATEQPLRCLNPTRIEQEELSTLVAQGNLNFSGCALVNVGGSALTLIGADLRRVQMGGVALPAANLAEANLANAQIINSSLAGSNLSNANLQGSTWQISSLTNANLQNADLSGASFIGTNLKDADLSGAILTDVTTDAETICPDGNKGPCEFE